MLLEILPSLSGFSIPLRILLREEPRGLQAEEHSKEQKIKFLDFIGFKSLTQGTMNINQNTNQDTLKENEDSEKNGRIFG